jgi:hypothetical protein
MTSHPRTTRIHLAHAELALQNSRTPTPSHNPTPPHPTPPPPPPLHLRALRERAPGNLA